VPGFGGARHSLSSSASVPIVCLALTHDRQEAFERVDGAVKAERRKQPRLAAVLVDEEVDVDEFVSAHDHARRGELFCAGKRTTSIRLRLRSMPGARRGDESVATCGKRSPSMRRWQDESRSPSRGARAPCAVSFNAGTNGSKCTSRRSDRPSKALPSRTVTRTRVDGLKAATTTRFGRTRASATAPKARRTPTVGDSTGPLAGRGLADVAAESWDSPEDRERNLLSLTPMSTRVAGGILGRKWDFQA